MRRLSIFFIGGIICVVIALVAVGLLADKLLQPEVTVSPIGQISRIEVRSNHNKVLNTIRDPVSIKQILTLVNNHTTGWTTPWAGVPIPMVVLDMYNNKTFVGHFGLGAGFFERQGNGGFVSKPVSVEQIQQLLTLAGLTEADLVQAKQ